MSELLVEAWRGSSGEFDTATDPAEIWLLNRPGARNALDPAMVNALHAALTAAESADRRVVVLRGAGLSFCSGADLRFLESHGAVPAASPRPFLSSIWDLTLAMERSSVIFVAALHGHAVAGGLELALACDVVLAAQGTKIGDGHVLNNLVPGGGSSARMERALGRSTATWLGLTGELLSAEDPRLAGWLHGVTPLDDLTRAASSVVETLLAPPRPAQQRLKQLLNGDVVAAGAAAKQRELDAFEGHWRDHDVPAALRAFLSRKKGAS